MVHVLVNALQNTNVKHAIMIVKTKLCDMMWNWERLSAILEQGKSCTNLCMSLVNRYQSKLLSVVKISIAFLVKFIIFTAFDCFLVIQDVPMNIKDVTEISISR